MQKSNKEDNVTSAENNKKTEDVRKKDEQTVRYSRSSGDYVYATSKGRELSINVRRTINYLDAQITPYDISEFPPVTLAIRELADKINVNYYNLKNEIISGDFLEDLRTSSFVDMVKNEKGEIIFADFVNAMYRVTFDEKLEMLTLERPVQMQRFLLNLGKDKPYYEIAKEPANNLANHRQIELYRLIEDELSSLQYSLGMKNKAMMINDHKWHELHISIYKVRKCTFSLETYLDTNKFVSTFLKRQSKTISEQSDIEIDYKTIKANKSGKNAEYIIISVRRKEIKYENMEEEQCVDIEEEPQKYFEDKKLDDTFKEYLKLKNIDEGRARFFKKRLIDCVKDTLPSQKELDVGIALRIIEYSIRGRYNDFFPLKKEEIELIQKNRANNNQDNNSKLKQLEDYYLNDAYEENDNKNTEIDTEL